MTANKREAKPCCDVMAQYREVVHNYYTAGGEHECAATAHADADEIHLSTGFDSVTLKLNFCPNCGVPQ